MVHKQAPHGWRLFSLCFEICILTCLATGPSRFLPKSTRFFLCRIVKRFAQYPRLGFLEVRVLEIALFAPRVCPYKFFSGDRNRRLCLGVDRKLREACLSEIFPDKISTGRSATKSRGEASNVRQSESICTSGIELKKMFSLNTFFYLSSAGDRAACEGARLTVFRTSVCEYQRSVERDRLRTLFQCSSGSSVSSLAPTRPALDCCLGW